MCLAGLAPPSAPLADEAQGVIQKIEAQRPNVAAVIRRFMKDMVGELRPFAPRGTKPDFHAALADALTATTPIAIQFCRVAQAIAEHNSSTAAIAVLRGFGPVADQYQFPRESDSKRLIPGSIASEGQDRTADRPTRR